MKQITKLRKRIEVEQHIPKKPEQISTAKHSTGLREQTKPEDQALKELTQKQNFTPFSCNYSQ